MGKYGEPWATSHPYNDREIDVYPIGPEGCEHGEDGFVEDTIAEVWDAQLPGKPIAERIVACVNACEGIPTEDLVEEKIKISTTQPESLTTEQLYELIAIQQRKLEEMEQRLISQTRLNNDVRAAIYKASRGEER